MKLVVKHLLQHPHQLAEIIGLGAEPILAQAHLDDMLAPKRDETKFTLGRIHPATRDEPRATRRARHRGLARYRGEPVS